MNETTAEHVSAVLENRQTENIKFAHFLAGYAHGRDEWGGHPFENHTELQERAEELFAQQDIAP